jgi:lipopolysaccharide biosynthesis regulator YciM
MESASLTYDQRLLAVQQLGRTTWPGLYDRAEDMFAQLVDETDFRISVAAAPADLSGHKRLAESH